MTGYSKDEQLARGPKRPARIKAARSEWPALRAAKLGPCRCASSWCYGRIELHHIVPRSLLGDDVADNLVPLCGWHHGCVTRRSAQELVTLAESLTDAEYAYCIDKLGEGAMERLFGVLAAGVRSGPQAASVRFSGVAGSRGGLRASTSSAGSAGATPRATFRGADTCLASRRVGGILCVFSGPGCGRDRQEGQDGMELRVRRGDSITESELRRPHLRLPGSSWPRSSS